MAAFSAYDRTPNQIALALLIGAGGAGLATALNIPASGFVGALVFTALANLLDAELVRPPKWLGRGARTVLGITIGAGLTRETLNVIAGASWAMIASLAAMALLSLGIAWLVHRVAHLPLATALCSASPGGLTAMVALAEDLEGDAPLVASVHLVRLLSILAIVPLLVAGVTGEPLAGSLAAQADIGPQPPLMGLRLLGLLAIALAIGHLAHRAHVPAGDLLAGLIVAALLNPTLFHLPSIPSSWPILAQWLIGTGVGTAIGADTLRRFGAFLQAGILVTVLLLVLGLGLGWLLSRLPSIDLATALLSTAPGGADTLIILAPYVGADQQIVTAMHVARLIMLVLLVPPVVRRLSPRHSPDTATGVQKPESPSE